jgi:hypothetical protein
MSSGSGRSAKETTNNTFGFGLDNEKGLQNNLLSQLIPDLINTIRSQVLAQLNIPNNNNNNNTNTANNNNNLDAPQNNNEDHIMDQDSCWSEASFGDDVLGMNDMVNDGPGTQKQQKQQQQQQAPPPSTPNNYPSSVHVQGANNKTMTQESNSNNNKENINNPENSNNNTKSNNRTVASNNNVSLLEKQSISGPSNFSSPLPTNLFVWDKNPQVRVHRIPGEHEFQTTPEGSSKTDDKSSYAMLRPSLVALLGESKNFYKTHGRDIEQQYLHRLNINEYFESQSYDEQIPTTHQTPYGNNRQTTRNTKATLKFRKCVILDSTMLNYIAKFSPDGNEFNAWFKNNVIQK